MNYRRINNNVQLAARHPTSVAPLKSPCFSVYHFNNGLLEQTKTVFGGKRKSSSESMFHPITKQQITEARIAASMNKLSLDNAMQNDEELPSSSVYSQQQDEGFFEDNTIDMADKESKYPQFKLVPEVKDNLDELLNDILPQQIYRSVNESCMAIIPYVPPGNILLPRTINIKCDEEKLVEERISQSPVENLDDQARLSDDIMHIDNVC